MLKPSEYQSNIFKFVSEGEGNGVVNAVAGSGKTTTVVKSIDLIDKDKTVLLLSLTNSIVDTLKAKVAEREGMKITTIHSLGCAALRKVVGGAPVVKDKIQRISYKLSKQFSIPDKSKGAFGEKMKDVVNMLKFNNLEATEDNVDRISTRHGILLSEEELAAAIKIFKISNETIKTEIDFVDMLYHPVKLGLEVVKYDFVFIDEAQDMSIVSQKLFKRFLKRGGRFVAVGDPNQSIYGFAGADENSFQNLHSMGDVTELPLSICYRCGSDIVENAKKIVPRIESNPNGIKGVVRNGFVSELRGSDMVLCRNNKPLVKMLFDLHKKGKNASIIGDELAKDLIRLISNTKTSNVYTSEDLMNYGLQSYADKLRKYGATDPENTTSYKSMEDKVEIINQLIFPKVKSTEDAINLIKTTLKYNSSSNPIILSTIHKAKGLECDRSFILNPELMPSKYAKLDWELRQETNMRYVACTRAKEELVFLLKEEEKKKPSKKLISTEDGE